jgi:transaldolase
MKIFLQSNSLEDIRTAWDTGLADGVALTLSELPDTAAVKARLAEIAREFAIPVCVPVSAFSASQIYREAKELARASDHAVIQIPFVEDAITPIRRLVADGVRVAATYIFSGVQAFFAAKIGAKMIAVPVEDLDAHGLRGPTVVAEIRDVLDHSDLECDLMVSSPQSANQFTEALLAGANCVCVSAPMMNEFMLHSLTDRGVDRFLREMSKRHKPRSV